jgi:hypothetical protein
MNEHQHLDDVADHAEDELRRVMLQNRMNPQDDDEQYAAWILDRAERIKRQRRIHQIEQWLIVAVVIIVAVLILIVLRW